MGHAGDHVLAERLAAAAAKVPVGGHYYHYKDRDRTYEVIGHAIDEATEQALIVYRAGYGEEVCYARTLASWLEPVAQDGRLASRFVQVR